MASIELFRPDPLTSFANRLQKDLGLSVRFRGKKIRTDYGQQPPMIMLPNMERAQEEDLEVLMGLCLLEAARCRFSDPVVVESIKDYPTKYVFTILQDEYVMRAIEPHWEGSQDLISQGLIKGREWLEEEMSNNLFRNKSFLNAPYIVKEIMEHERVNLQIAFDVSDEKQVKDVTDNLEVRRVALLWLDVKLGCDFVQSPFVAMWDQHPWKPIFDEITETPAVSTKDVLGQAIRIVERLGINPQPIRRAMSLQKKKACFLADFVRPVEEARELVKEAEAKQKEAQEAIDLSEKKVREVNRTVRHQLEETPESDELEQKINEYEEAGDVVKVKRNRLAKQRKRLKVVKSSERDAKKRLRKVNKAFKTTKKKTSSLAKKIKKGQNAEEYLETLNTETIKANAVVRRARRIKGSFEKKQGRTSDMQNVVTQSTNEYNTSQRAKEHCAAKVEDQKRVVAKVEEGIRNDVMKLVGQEVKELQEKEQQAVNAAKYATNKANEVLRYIKDKDADAEAPLASGATEKLVEQSFEKYKNQGTNEELTGAVNPEDLNAEIDDRLAYKDDLPARKYVPFTREYDSISEVEETMDGRIKYEDTADKLEDVIEKTKNSLNRLYSPYKTSIKTNVRQGRFDPRKAVRVILSGKGLPVDVSRVFRDIKTTRTPQVAVSLLLDCSRSMNKVEGVSLRSMLDAASENLITPLHDEPPMDYTPEELECGAYVWRKVRRNKEVYFAKTIEFDFVGKGKTVKDALYNLQDRLSKSEHTRKRTMQEAVVALSEVMMGLNIPYEVLGHTTNSSVVPSLDLDGENITDNKTFSRFAPFKGYVFKGYSSTQSSANIFSDIDAQDNLDGEGVLWAASRLCQRTENTKILIVLSDGYPAARYSHEGELQRHLYGVCKALKGHEKNGMFLWGLGVKADKTKDYFDNAAVIQNAEELPESVLGIVEHVLINIRGTMA